MENFHTHQIWDSNIKGIAVWTTDAPETVGGEEVVADKKTFIKNQAEDPILSPGRVGMNAINYKKRTARQFGSPK